MLSVIPLLPVVRKGLMDAQRLIREPVDTPHKDPARDSRPERDKGSSDDGVEHDDVPAGRQGERGYENESKRPAVNWDCINLGILMCHPASLMSVSIGVRRRHQISQPLRLHPDGSGYGP